MECGVILGPRLACATANGPAALATALTTAIACGGRPLLASWAGRLAAETDSATAPMTAMPRAWPRSRIMLIAPDAMPAWLSSTELTAAPETEETISTKPRPHGMSGAASVPRPASLIGIVDSQNCPMAMKTVPAPTTRRTANRYRTRGRIGSRANARMLIIRAMRPTRRLDWPWITPSRTDIEYTMPMKPHSAITATRAAPVNAGILNRRSSSSGSLTLSSTIAKANQIALTLAARNLVEHAERIVVELRAAEASLCSATGVTGLLRVGIPFREGPHIMSFALTEVRRRFPDMEIRLTAITDET